MPQIRRLLATREVAALLGVSRRTVCLWTQLGKLPGLRVGGQWRFRQRALERWLTKNKYLPDHHPLTAEPGKRGGRFLDIRFLWDDNRRQDEE